MLLAFTKPFKASAYHNGEFISVSSEELKGKWSVFVFYPADFTFVCPTELGDLADNYAAFKKLGVEISTPISAWKCGAQGHSHRHRGRTFDHLIRSPLSAAA